MILFPDSWKLEEANKICKQIVDCINKTAPVVDYETPYKMIRTTNVKKGRVNLKEARRVDEATFIKWNRRLTPKRNDIVLTREAPLGDVGLLRTDETVFLGQRTMIYRADEASLNQYFLYYSLLGPTLQAQLKTLGSGSTVEHVRVPDAEKLIIPYPPYQEQKKIAAVLSSYDDLIENNKCRISLLEKMAEEIYREWFVRFRFPGYRNAEFEKGIPKGWGGEYANKYFGHIKGKSYTSSEISTNDELGLPFVTLKSFHRGGGYREDALKYYSGKFRNQQVVNEGDVVMAVTDMTQNREVVGRVARVPDMGDKGAVISLDVIKLIPKTISSTFLYSYMRYSGFGDFIKAFANGANVLHLKPDLVTQQKIIMPPEDLRRGYEDIVNPIHEQIGFISKSIKILENTRNQLLPRLISGKLSVENLEIQFPPSMQQEEAASAEA